MHTILIVLLILLLLGVIPVGSRYGAGPAGGLGLVVVILLILLLLGRI